MSRLEIRLLGELKVVREGVALPLPASKKTRALLAYLVATGRAHLRERLCDLLWEGPEDPRAELRWSLTKLRPLLNEDGKLRLLAGRERVGVEAHDVDIDLARVRALLAPEPSKVRAEALRAAIELLEGEFLDGLDLAACPRFYEWCVGEREAVSVLRVSALRELLGRLAGAPEEALAYARKWAAADPLSEPAHAAVVRLLGALGRPRDALAQHGYSRQLLESELPALSGELDAELRALHHPAPTAPRRVEAPPRGGEAATSVAPPLVGRQTERARIDEHIARAAEHSRVLLLLGEPGIGKSRLLDFARDRAAARGGRTLAARAFEAELARPYGIWIDALRQDLAVLRPQSGSAGAEPGNRTKLFDAVVQLLRDLAGGPRVAALLFDDLQWADDASCSLLHYVVRALAGHVNLAIVCAARPDELEDSVAARSLLQSLRRAEQLEELHLGPLSAQETVQLVKAVAPAIDAGAIHAESDGNPLFALALAQARAAGLDWPERTLGSLIHAQLARLDNRARDVLTYAAALGRAFTPELLGPACGFDAPSLLGALGELERRGLLRPAGDARLDFAHDLVRQAAYRGLSQPRRRLLHAQIARSLAVAAESDESLGAELARHASAAGDHPLAARACTDAGERALRAFANVEAATLAETGLWHLHRLPRTVDRLQLHMRLLEVKLLARTTSRVSRPPEIAEEIAQAVAEAEGAGLHALAATGHHLLAIWYQEAGDHAHAQESSMRSAAVGRAADEASRARHLARTARCLMELERDAHRARTLLRESAAAAERSGLEVCELVFGEALVQRWDGDADRAAQSLERALAIARRSRDRWSEFRCLTHLAMVGVERGQFDQVREHASTLLQVGIEMGEADVPFARVLLAVVELRSDPARAYGHLEDALRALRDVSDKSHLAYGLNQAAVESLRLGRAAAAAGLATEALAAAEAMHRSSERLIAGAILARCSAARGDRHAAREAVTNLCATLAAGTGWSARARAELATAAAAANMEITTPAPTRSDVA